MVKHQVVCADCGALGLFNPSHERVVVEAHFVEKKAGYYTPAGKWVPPDREWIEEERETVPDELVASTWRQVEIKADPDDPRTEDVTVWCCTDEHEESFRERVEAGRAAAKQVRKDARERFELAAQQRAEQEDAAEAALEEHQKTVQEEREREKAAIANKQLSYWAERAAQAAEASKSRERERIDRAQARDRAVAENKEAVALAQQRKRARVAAETKADAERRAAEEQAEARKAGGG